MMEIRVMMGLWMFLIFGMIAGMQIYIAEKHKDIFRAGINDVNKTRFQMMKKLKEKNACDGMVYSTLVLLEIPLLVLVGFVLICKFSVI